MIAPARVGELVVDTSVLAALVLDEPDAARIDAVLMATPRAVLSAVSRVEAGLVVLGRLGDETAEELDRLLERFEIEVVAVTTDQAHVALDAFRRFGKGRHPAALNFGDCFVYALARSLDLPLLCKGDDFARTDLRLVEY